jgi:hypothetical protein
MTDLGGWSYPRPYGEPQPDPPLRDHDGGQEVVLLARARRLEAARAFPGEGGYGKKGHFSLHASDQWHMKEGHKERLSWAKPDEVVPGYTRAVGIVQPVAVAHREDSAPEGVTLIPVSLNADPTTFSIFIERPGANLDGWPGKNADGTTFVGRIPLAAAAGTCCIVALQEPLQPGRLELPRPSDDELRQMRLWAVRGVLVITIIGKLSDGAIALIDLRADPSVVATIDRAL